MPAGPRMNYNGMFFNHLNLQFMCKMKEHSYTVYVATNNKSDLQYKYKKW